jgi:DNA-binding SARP family transcriptional activator
LSGATFPATAGGVDGIDGPWRGRQVRGPAAASYPALVTAVELTLLSRVAYRDQEVTSPRLRSLLALLAGDLRQGCSSARLVDGLWPYEQPENPTKALQVLVSRARARLGPDVIASTPTGYRLTLSEDRVDASAVLLSAAASARHARAGDHEAALAHAAAGLALYDGAERGGAELDDPLSALRTERASTHRSLLRARALALSRLERHAEALEPLIRLVAERPRDEEVLLELLRSEAAAVGPSAALARYDAYRRSLRRGSGSCRSPRSTAAWTTASPCCGAARATRPSATTPCTPWSSGAGTCSNRRGRRPCAPCRSSPAASPPTRRDGCSATTGS